MVELEKYRLDGLNKISNSSSISLSSSVSSKSSSSTSSISTTFHIEINGEVKNPGTYQVNVGDRLEVLIDLAGGISEFADTLTYKNTFLLEENLSIYIPSLTVNTKLSLNNSTKELLETLPGIGSTFSQRILEYREKNGNFLTINEIKKVTGIGQKTFDGIKELIKL